MGVVSAGEVRAVAEQPAPVRRIVEHEKPVLCRLRPNARPRARVTFVRALRELEGLQNPLLPVDVEFIDRPRARFSDDCASVGPKTDAGREIESCLDDLRLRACFRISDHKLRSVLCSGAALKGQHPAIGRPDGVAAHSHTTAHRNDLRGTCRLAGHRVEGSDTQGLRAANDRVVVVVTLAVESNGETAQSFLQQSRFAFQFPVAERHQVKPPARSAVAAEDQTAAGGRPGDQPVI